MKLFSFPLLPGFQKNTQTLNATQLLTLILMCSAWDVWADNNTTNHNTTHHNTTHHNATIPHSPLSKTDLETIYMGAIIIGSFILSCLAYKLLDCCSDQKHKQLADTCPQDEPERWLNTKNHASIIINDTAPLLEKNTSATASTDHLKTQPSVLNDKWLIHFDKDAKPENSLRPSLTFSWDAEKGVLAFKTQKHAKFGELQGIIENGMINLETNRFFADLEFRYPSQNRPYDTIILAGDISFINGSVNVSGFWYSTNFKSHGSFNSKKTRPLIKNQLHLQEGQYDSAAATGNKNHLAR